MKLSEIRQLLAAEGIRLTRSLGQNFLHDANQLRRIVAAAELSKTDRVLEIGPGLGPLTDLLIERAGHVLAIEKDARLVELLKRRFQPSVGAAKLDLVHADALEYLRLDPRDWSEWKLVANLPYSVASPVLIELARGGDSPGVRNQAAGASARSACTGPQRLVATLQLEVARRLFARPGDPDYGVLTLLLQLGYAPMCFFKIPASCFFPEPDVDSACVSLCRRAQPLVPPERRHAFVRIVKRSFSQRRKMSFKLLKTDWPEPELRLAFEQAELTPQVRAEEISLDQFVRLTRALGTDSKYG